MFESGLFSKRCRIDTFDYTHDTSPHSHRGVKRMALFDNELHQVRKRMKATVPTAEEALAAIIPHLLALRQLLVESESKNQTLMTHLKTLRTAYDKEVMQKQQIQRQLESAQYRFALLAPRPDAV